MTYQIYTHQQLRLKSIARLKEIYNIIGCSTQVRDKRCKDAWITAITDHQASKICKADSQAIAQSELNSYIEAQAYAIAPQRLTKLEINFYHHEVYAGEELIAVITYDKSDFTTQPWLVIVDGVEKFRAATPAKCDRYIEWHHKDGTLQETFPAPLEFPEISPEVQEEFVDECHNFEQQHQPCTVNEEIACECQKYGFKLCNGKDVYNNRTKIGEVFYTDGHWWVLGATQPNQKRLLCDSLLDAVWWLSRVNTPNAQTLYRQQILHKPLEQLTPADWRWLQQHEIVTQLVAV